MLFYFENTILYFQAITKQLINYSKKYQNRLYSMQKKYSNITAVLAFVAIIQTLLLNLIKVDFEFDEKEITLIIFNFLILYLFRIFNKQNHGRDESSKMYIKLKQIENYFNLAFLSGLNLLIIHKFFSFFPSIIGFLILLFSMLYLLYMLFKAIY